MDIHIINFRQIRDLHLSFKRGENILIDGDNGVGKTSVCMAIQWCLFNVPKKNIKPIGEKDAKRTKVTITLEDGTKIERSKTPDELIVIRGETREIVKNNQNLVNSLIGDKNSWVSGSYLSQKSIHTLISSCSSDKSLLIHSLTFGDNEDDVAPEEWVKKLKKKYKELDVKINKLNGSLESQEEDLIAHCWDREKNYEECDVSELSREINDMKLEIRQDQVKSKRLKNHLKAQNRENYGKKHDLLREKVKILENQQNRVSEIAGWEKEMGKLGVKERFLNIEFSENDKYIASKVAHHFDSVYMTLNDAEKELKYCVKSHENAKKGKELDIEINNLEKELSEGKKINSRIKSYELYQEKLRELELCDKYDEYELINKERDIRDKIKYRDNLLKCPCCDNFVQFKNGELILSSEESDDIEELEEELKKVKEKLKSSKKWNSLNLEAKELKCKEEKREKVDTRELKEKLQKLTKKRNGVKKGKYDANIEVKEELLKLVKEINCAKDINLEIIINSQLIERYKELKKLIKEEKEKITLEDDCEKVKRELRDVEKRIKEQEEWEVIYKTLKFEKCGWEEEDLEEKELDLSIMEMNNKVCKLLKKYKKVENERNELSEKMKCIDKCIKHVHRVAHDSIQLITSSIQHYTNEMLRNIYIDTDELMQIHIETSKVRGSGEKQEVNVVIHHKDREWDSNDLSGGEKSILSLALTVGCNKVSGGNVIILDESFNAISIDKRSSCDRALKNILEECCVVSVLHGADVKFYDKAYTLT